MRLSCFMLLVGILMIPDPSCALVVCNPAGQTEEGVYIDAVLEQSGGLKVGFPRAEREAMTPSNDGLEDFNELFLARGWGDGLPLIPPTPERVEAMVAGYDLPGDFPIATLAPMEGVATVEKLPSMPSWLDVNPGICRFLLLLLKLSASRSSICEACRQRPIPTPC